MTWQRETGRDGLPVWRGWDSIVNAHRHQARENYGCGYPAIGGMVLLALVFIFAGSTGGRAVDALGAVVGWLLLIAAAPGVFVIWKLEKDGGVSARAFFDEQWTLFEVKNATFHGLAFRRKASGNRPAESWTAPLSEIARVEAGMTKQWIGSRRIGALIHEVSPYEAQAFLFMNDGSRRVICSVNGNLEATATLAQSVRSWLEEVKAVPPAQPQRAEARPANEWREGFDL